MCNKDLRNAINESGFKYWQIADAIGINNGTLSVWLRHELTGKRKQAIIEAIEQCKRKQEEEGKV